MAVIGHLSASQMKPIVMRRWLQALKLCVSQLTIDYLANLLSAQTFYLKSTLVTLIKQLWVPSNSTTVCCNIHQAIDAIVQLVPTAPSVLVPLLTKNYPFKGRGPDVQVSCVQRLSL